MKLHKMIEMYLKYDNMHINRRINAFICINSHVNSCTNCMLSIPKSIMDNSRQIAAHTLWIPKSLLLL